ncbi:HD domain-containing protein [Geothermobacter ehrlichii]|uniref:HD domain-containing protein n=1 Tax=Geothermobacter ehrlichii TaxID=213224 RepID=A0A5D3WFU6_9BACT|nr:HD domain-containing phosphohydrolase [Geothermobacter ehrlichii]TYO96777.1 HD domain-containing protein [Geothermobacter ehrlichii]
MLSEIVDVVLKSLYARSASLYNHSMVTGRLAQQLVVAGDLWRDYDPQQAHIAGLLHDAGKLFLPDAILLKSGPLDDTERGVMELHPIWGGQFCQGTVLETFKQVVLQHHEKPDGTGYPLGTREVCFEARIIQVADTLAALMDDRPYRREILHPHFLLRQVRETVEGLFAGEKERKVLHAVRVVLGLAEGKHARPPLSLVTT